MDGSGRVDDQKFVCSSTLELPWYYLGPASEFVHEMDGLSPNFGPLSTWTVRRRPSSSVEARFDPEILFIFFITDCLIFDGQHIITDMFLK